MTQVPSAYTCMLILESLAAEPTTSDVGRKASRLRKALMQVPGYSDKTGSDEGLWLETRALLEHEGYGIEGLLELAARVGESFYEAETWWIAATHKENPCRNEELIDPDYLIKLHAGAALIEFFAAVRLEAARRPISAVHVKAYNEGYDKGWNAAMRLAQGLGGLP